MQKVLDSRGGADLVGHGQISKPEIAPLYGLSRPDFAHILGTFPLVFPDDPAGEQKKESFLATYDTSPKDYKSLPDFCSLLTRASCL
jgi:hypothetical protein